jgi:hypothetical protein
LLHAAAALQQPSINIFRPGPTGVCLDEIAREMPNSVTKSATPHFVGPVYWQTEGKTLEFQTLKWINRPFAD